MIFRLSTLSLIATCIVGRPGFATGSIPMDTSGQVSAVLSKEDRSLDSPPPPGVRLNDCSVELKRRTYGVLRRAFREGGPGFADSALYEPGGVICGPFLWRMLSTAPGISQIATKRMMGVVPGQLHPAIQRLVDTAPPETSDVAQKMKQASGAAIVDQAFVESAGLRAFAELLAMRYPTTKAATLFPLTVEDFDVYWSLTTVDIERPVVILRLGEARLLLNFLDSGRLFTIDDYTVLGSHAAPGPGH